MLYVVLGTLLGFRVGSDGFKNIKGNLATNLFSSFLGFLFGVCLYFVIGGVIGLELPVVDMMESYPIYELEAGSESTYLLSDTVNDVKVLKYLTDGKRDKKICKVKALDASILPTDGTPNVVVVKKEFKHNWYNLFATSFGHPVSYVFNVPKGSTTPYSSVD